jgi:hypothetical protein
MRCGAIHRAPPAGIQPVTARATLSTPPGSCNYHSRMILGDALGNDVLGNCVEIAQLRSIQLRLANAMGTNWIPTRDMAVALYSEYAGYDPAKPETDQGSDVASAMLAWCQRGYEVNPQLLDIPAWLTVDPAQPDHMKAAIHAAGCVLLTLSLPQAAIDDTTAWDFVPASDPDTVPGTAGSHRVMCGRYDKDSFWLVSWGMEIPASPGFIAAYGLGADIPIVWDWFQATGLSLPGLDRWQVEADLAHL